MPLALRIILSLSLFAGWPSQGLPGPQPESASSGAPFLLVLGISQDGGYPQSGSKKSPAWGDVTLRRHVVCLALVDPASGQRWMFEATPDFPRQLQRLDEVAPVASTPGLSGIFLTHAHVGHYLGLAQLGHEVLGARQVAVWAMPRLQQFLRSNGPWSQLVRYGNISLKALAAQIPVVLNSRLSVTPFRVPHRQEFSEVVGFRIQGPRHSALFIPDIDSWEQWDQWQTQIEDMVSEVEVAYLDGTFYADGEIPGRDMSGFPHPFITHSMKRFESLALAEKNKIRFIHLNHTNPALRADSPERRKIEQSGFRVAQEGERFEL